MDLPFSDEISYVQLSWWAFLVFILLYHLYPQLLWYDSNLHLCHAGSIMQRAVFNPPIFKIYTPKTLAAATSPNFILIAVLGKVYNVTSGAAFYGPEGPYHIFSGRDASRGLAKHSFDPSMLRPIDMPVDALKDLNKMERDEVANWAQYFASKYIHVGNLVNE